MTMTTDHVVITGECLEVLKTLESESIDAVITDPPYEIIAWYAGQSAKKTWWDTGVFGPEVWSECLRVLKPGGHLMAFNAARMCHRMTTAVEAAGFEIRDVITWLYATGMPKSVNIANAIDHSGGSPQDQSAVLKECRLRLGLQPHEVASIIGVSLDSYLVWEDGRVVPGSNTRQWVTPSKRFRSQLVELLEGYDGDRRQITGSVKGLLGMVGNRYGDAVTPEARRWSGWGTGLRPASEPIVVARKPLVGGTVHANVLEYGTGALNVGACQSSRGTWPTNVVVSHAPDCDEESESCVTGCPVAVLALRDSVFPTFRFQAKAPTSERVFSGGVSHPTVKPLGLMRWLVRLVAPAGSRVLDPFAGSGATSEACLLEGVHSVSIEKNPEYAPLINERLGRHPLASPVPVVVD